MAKQLNVNLAFTADTGKAKAQLQDLQRQLSQIINTPKASGVTDGITKDIQQATQAAAELKVHLQNATNVNTGSLDFAKLNQSIKNSGSSLSEYASKIQSIGPEGQKAFALLAQSVASAEVPIRRSNALLSELWTTMKNTARWQLTSSMLHGFMGAVQSAVGYTERLNGSLNDIRIVTGQSTDQMAEFARQANKAAKALSATTTDYTNAALIYYQQGLNEEEVKARTDLTIKMANASGQSAEVVSDQLTAIWNNYAKGSENLEHFADVLTKLGADTASSSEEISIGLEKFAAIGDTIGLSYDNAAAALATVTATTRQSAEVVGTAFKTIFARIQGLNLGETLDDGTSLNKYSEALSKVGISIFEQNGEIKKMDDILDEMGAKWQTMNKDQQIALAQTVAGVRQYTQLVALMDNWDFYEQNLFSAQTSDGTLQKQADIYAESWEAASDRVEAALQGLYDSLLNDEAFIDILNGTEKIISGFEMLIDSAGGFGGVITGLGVIFTNVFRKQIAESITDASYSLMSWTETGRQKIREEKKQEIENILSVQEQGENNSVQDVQNKVIRAQLESQQALIDKAKQLSSIEQETYKILLDQQKARGELAVQAAQELEKAKQKKEESESDLFSGASHLSLNKDSEEQKRQLQQLKEAENIERKLFEERKKFKESGGTSLSKALVGDEVSNVAGVSLFDIAVDISELEEAKEKIIKSIAGDNTNLAKKLRVYLDSTKEVIEKTEELGNKVEDAERKINFEGKEIQDNANKKKENAQATNKVKESENNLTNEVKETTDAYSKQNEELKENEQNKKRLNSSEIAQNFVAGTNAALSAASAIQSFSSAMDTLNSDAAPLEKIVSALTSVSMGGGMAANAFTSLNKITVSSGKTLGVAAAETKLASAVLSKFGLSAGSAGASMLALGGYVAIAATAIAGLMAIINHSIDVYNEDANAAKRAAEAAENLNSAAKEAQSSFDDLLSSFDNYDSAIDKLDECAEKLKNNTATTEEWNKALSDVNDQIWNILEKYPELSKAENLFNKDGTFNQDTVDSFIAQQKKNTDNARTAALSANAISSKAQAVADQTSLKREIQSIINRNTLTYDAADGTALQKNQKHGQENFNALWTLISSPEGYTTEEFNNAVNEFVSGFESTTDTFEEEMRGAASKARDLGKTFESSGTQMENTAHLLASQVLGKDITEEQENKYAENYTARTAEIREEVLKSAKDGINRLSGKGDQDVIDLWERYQNATGTKYQLSSNGVQGNDLNRSFEYINEEGIKVVITAEQLATAIATAEAQNEVLYGNEEKGTTGLRGDIESQLGSSIAENINSEVSIDLLNSLAQTMNLEDETTKKALEILFQKGQSAAEQTKIIEELLNKMTAEEQELMEINQLTQNAVEKYELDADIIEEQAKRIQNAYELTAVEATKLAIQNQRMNKGVEELSENWEDWQKVLKKGNLNKEEKTTLEYATTVKELTDVISDLVGATEDLSLPEEFFDSEKNLELIGEAAKGSEKAVNELGAAIGLATVQSMKIDNSFLTGDEDSDNLKIYNDFLSNKDIVLAGIEELQKKIADGQDLVGQGLEEILSGSADGANSWVDSLNQMAEATYMTVDEMNSLLNTLGLEADVTVKEIPQEMKVPVYKVQMDDIKKDPVTGMITSYTTRSIPQESETHTGYVSVAQIGVNGEAPGEPKVKYIGNGKVSQSSVKTPKGGGGGGKSSKPNKGVKKSDTVERYKEVNDAIDDVTNALNDANKESDRLFGADKLKNIDKENKLILENIKLLDQKKKEAAANLEIDRLALEQAAEAAGVKLDIDPNSNLITNYTEAMTTLFNQLDEAHKKAGDTIEEAEQEVIDGIQEKIDNLKDAITQYDETRELMEDLDDEKEEERRKIQDNNYKKLTYKLELDNIVTDNEMRELDYYFGKMEGDIEKAVEAFGILQDKLGTTSDKLFDYESHFNSLEQAYAAGQISQADYIAGLQECYDALYDNIEALNDLDKQMMEYYGETYDLALEKIETYTSQMEHLSSVLDHYKSIMSLLGKESDFETMGVIIEGQVKVAEDSYKSSKSIYELAKGQKEAAYEELMSAENDAERELLQKNYDKALEEFNNAQEIMLTDAETYGELIKEALVNSMNQAAKEMEKALTGVWGSFENLQEQMGLHSTHQEEFLTNTNKLYETNKLLNQVAQDMEKTDNRASKAKYQAFSKEIEQLQEKDKLSKLELEIAQAKYNMLQAQIALEEAQNAKSMVRLTRDEEGNYGYVYTADKDKVNQAEQDLADAENDLYNIRLNATNDYAEKIVQARADMLDKLKELDERAAEDEEYRLNQYENDKANIQKAYYDLIDDYSRLHTIAQEEDVRVQQDAWTNFYSDVIDQGEDWKNAITDYNNKIILSFKEWEAKSDLLTEAIAEDITDITDASENLKNTLVEDVIPAMADTLDEVRTLTAEYALQRESVLDLADAYKTLADRAGEAIKVEAQKAKDANSELQNTDTTKDPNAQLQETRPADAGPGSSSSGGDGVLNVGDEVTFTGGVYYNDAEGGGPTGSRGPGKKVRVDRIKPGSNYPIHVISGDSAFGWLREDQLSGFNTGGYTGEWGAEGKLALLHEKELVLNAVDTENLLASVQILRELTKAIDLNATWASMGIGSLNAVGVSDTSTTLEQKVEIRAEFPNVTDHNEIEEAFNTLINRASQYVNRF